MFETNGRPPSRVSAMATRHSDYSVKDGSISNGGVPTRQTRRGIEPHPNIELQTIQTNNTWDNKTTGQA